MDFEACFGLCVGAGMGMRYVEQKRSFTAGSGVPSPITPRPARFIRCKPILACSSDRTDIKEPEGMRTIVSWNCARDVMNIVPISDPLLPVTMRGRVPSPLRCRVARSNSS